MLTLLEHLCKYVADGLIVLLNTRASCIARLLRSVREPGWTALVVQLRRSVWHRFHCAVICAGASDTGAASEGVMMRITSRLTI